MFYPIDKEYYQAIIKDDRFESYSGIFTPELARFFHDSEDHNLRYYYDHNKSVLIYSTDDSAYFDSRLKNIIDDANFMNRNIVPTLHQPNVFDFIKAAEIEHNFNPKYSENIWVHRSADLFVSKYCQPNLKPDQITNKLWFGRFTHKVPYDSIEHPIRFRIFSTTDKVIYNSNVAADIINNLGIDFCIGKNSELIVSRQKIDHVKYRIKTIKSDLIATSIHPFRLFQPNTSRNKGGRTII